MLLPWDAGQWSLPHRIRLPTLLVSPTHNLVALVGRNGYCPRPLAHRNCLLRRRPLRPHGDAGGGRITNELDRFARVSRAPSSLHLDDGHNSLYGAWPLLEHRLGMVAAVPCHIAFACAASLSLGQKAVAICGAQHLIRNWLVGQSNVYHRARALSITLAYRAMTRATIRFALLGHGTSPLPLDYGNAPLLET